MKKYLLATMLLGLALNGIVYSAKSVHIMSASASTNSGKLEFSYDEDPSTRWDTGKAQESGQWVHYILSQAVKIDAVKLDCKASADDYPRGYEVYITIDPMNWGEPVAKGSGSRGEMDITFKPKYGNHVKIVQTGNAAGNFWSIHEIGFNFAASAVEYKPASDDVMSRPYMDPTLPVEQRVANLLEYMTAADKMELMRESWGTPEIPHLKTPPIFKVEAIHGFSYSNGGPTIFPQCIGQAATWNKALIRELGVAIGQESKAAGVLAAWSPVLDVARDPRWGRCEETFGEDPYLVTEIGCAWIDGVQSLGLVTTPKHFAGHGAPLGGRDSHDIGLSEREMREIHLPPFRAAFKRCKAESVMMNYSDWLDTVSAASTYLLKGILREEWGFDGFVVSDCGALRNMTAQKHYIVEGCADAAALALKAGVAVNCGNVYNCDETLKAAKEGRFPQEDLDFAASSILRVMFRHGLFENRPVPFNWDKQYDTWNCPKHREIALRVARESMTLLKNEKGLLPLDKNIASIAVIGPSANDVQLGDYSAKHLPGQLISVLDGVKKAVSKDTTVYYAKGCGHTEMDTSGFDEAVEMAKKSTVAVLVLGDSTGGSSKKETSGENNDRASLLLPGVQQQLLEAVTKTGTPVVLVVVSGRPYTLEYSVKNNPAILMAWLAGQESGTATADVLFGMYNPAGRLPMTLPQDTAQLPLYYNFKTSGRKYEYSDMEFYPRYRFGYGLSYTTFEYSGLKTDVKPDGTITVVAAVKNVGKAAGDEVAQLYITDLYASVRTQVMQLKGFERIHLEPGQESKVSFALQPYDISLLDSKMDRVVEPGKFKVFVGGVSPAYKAGDNIKDSIGHKNPQEGVNGEFTVDKKYAADFTYTLAVVDRNQEPFGNHLVVDAANKGNLTDVGEVKLYDNGKYTGESHRYEIDPGAAKKIEFHYFPTEKGTHELTVVGKYAAVSKTVQVK